MFKHVGNLMPELGGAGGVEREGVGLTVRNKRQLGEFPKMSSLPDELWRRILEIGIGIGMRSLTYKDLCCISISCRRLHRLSSEDSLWNHLLSSDFSPLPHPHSSAASSSSSKSLYKFRFDFNSGFHQFSL